MFIGKKSEAVDDPISQRTRMLFAEHQQFIHRRIDKVFAGLMLFQWFAAIAAAFWLSPLTWAGATSRPHIHVWAALFLGGAITLGPILTAVLYPGAVITRQCIAVGQMLMSGLLIHLAGGRIETHFHVFGSLAFLAFYRDWRVIVTGTIITAADHILRGFLWPQSVYGVQTIEAWRWLEHAGWVIFEDIFLIFSCIASVREMEAVCERDAKLEQSNTELERQVEARSAKIVHQAFHDALSGLPNRLRFNDRVEQALVRAKRQNSVVAVLFIDLDNFKFINDSLGQERGDQLLVEIAHRLKEGVPPGGTIARMGGDEFTILLESITNEEAVLQLAMQIVKRLHDAVHLDARDVFISCSIGIALSCEENTDAESLIRDADTAMYQAKLNGKSSAVVFDRSMNDRIVERVEIETGLRRAIERGEFRVFYQPIMNLKTGDIHGAEALVRWEHPKSGLISPAKFIPIAEETGLIVPIGAWVLKEACRQAKAWQPENNARHPFVISVNLSGRQLQQADLRQTVADVLQETQLPPNCLKLEITESVMMNDVEDAVAKLNELKELGVLLAVDDFGTGYSSLSYLQRLPVNTVKIDQSFIHVMESENQHAAIVQAIITLCRAFDLEVTGEGIENAGQLHQLQSLGCDYGQGYLFAKPVPSEAFGALLAAENPNSLSLHPTPSSSEEKPAASPPASSRKAA